LIYFLNSNYPSLHTSLFHLKSKPSKKPDQLVVLKPQQIQLMNQLEMNRAQLSQDQLQMLAYLKGQYSMMQQQQSADKSNKNGQGKWHSNIIEGEILLYI
jgi:hypothetical protein